MVVSEWGDSGGDNGGVRVVVTVVVSEWGDRGGVRVG